MPRRRCLRVGPHLALPGDRPGRRDACPGRRVRRRGHPDPNWDGHPGPYRGAAASCPDSDADHRRRRVAELQVSRDATARRWVRYQAEAHLVAASRARCRRRQTGCCRPADRDAGPRAVARLTGALPGAGGNVGIGAGVTGGDSTTGLGAAATTGSGCGAGAGSGGAAAVLAGGVGVSAGAGAGGKASRSRRATGASTVDDALFTNSPSSLSLARTSLLETLSSFASSCTRALPATGLLRAKPAASRAVPLVGGRAHRWRFIECPLPFTAPYGCPDGGVRPMR